MVTMVTKEQATTVKLVNNLLGIGDEILVGQGEEEALAELKKLLNKSGQNREAVKQTVEGFKTDDEKLKKMIGVLRRMDAGSIEAFPHQGPQQLPFEQIIDALRRIEAFPHQVSPDGGYHTFDAALHAAGGHQATALPPFDGGGQHGGGGCCGASSCPDCGVAGVCDFFGGIGHCLGHCLGGFLGGCCDSIGNCLDPSTCCAVIGHCCLSTLCGICFGQS